MSKHSLPFNFPIGAAVLLAACACLLGFGCYQEHTNQTANKMRSLAWDQETQEATTPEQKQVLAWVRKNTEGKDCRTNNQRQDEPFVFSWNPATYRARVVERKIAGEAACLDQLKGQTLVGLSAANSQVLGVSLPR